MTLAVARPTDFNVIRVQERRRSNAAGLHGRVRGNRRNVELVAIEESLTSWIGDEDDE